MKDRHLAAPALHPAKLKARSDHKELSWPVCDASYTWRRDHDGSIDACPAVCLAGQVGPAALRSSKDRGARMLLSFQRPPRLPGGGLPPWARPWLRPEERIEQYSALRLICRVRAPTAGRAI